MHERSERGPSGRLLTCRSLPLLPRNGHFHCGTDNYLTRAFGYGTIGASVAFPVVGIAVAFSGGSLVGPA